MKRGDIKANRVTASKPIQNKSFKDLEEEFIRHAEIRNLSEWTIKSYKYHTQYFLEFAGEDLMCKDIGLEMIEGYILFMKEKKGISNPVTLNSYLQNISPIIKYGFKKRYILYQFVFPFVKGQETLKDIYSEEEMKALLETPNKKDFITIRTHTIIWVLASTGIRARELRELRNMNVDLINRAITVNQTKNKKPRRVPISKSLYDVLLYYIELRGGNEEDYLFPTVYNEILAMSSLQDSVKKYCNDRGVFKTSLHLFRHTFITNAVNQNVNPLILKRITGHSTMNQLNRYYNARTIDMVDVIDDIAPKTNRKKSYFK
ncbi:tyrosine-type recombinase/integrase [Sinanaerobacter chloroacetimidivorans]|uniref:Site-specific integrase n=1 Tax=Sinanaerobacter chloroacetimidivorans TaxID=2818044 RepID=A0A8J7VZN0_9FIRM|nr:site-specific integrase [Sinanaerobacter chloroacetimidivorans]MBR0598097.1 site-specific integrase [Sinanaerobacter chloroacetimidivorans]